MATGPRDLGERPEDLGDRAGEGRRKESGRQESQDPVGQMPTEKWPKSCRAGADNNNYNDDSDNEATFNFWTGLSFVVFPRHL